MFDKSVCGFIITQWFLDAEIEELTEQLKEKSNNNKRSKFVFT